MAPRRPWYTILRVAAATLAAWLFVHALVQGVGAVQYWQPCFALGYGSGPCAYLQYEAPNPTWIGLMTAWLIEAPLAVAVFALALAARARVALTFGAMLAVLVSNLVFDYVVTPAVNGGYTSADNPPGFGLPGAVLLMVAAVLLAVAAAVPTRSRDTRLAEATPLTAG